MLLVSEKSPEANEQKILHTTNDLGIAFLKFLSDFFRAEESFISSIKLVEEMRLVSFSGAKIVPWIE